MGDCPHCGHPRVWSDDHQALWCAVYGSHSEIRTPSLLLLKACEFSDSGSAPRQRALRNRRRVVS